MKFEHTCLLLLLLSCHKGNKQGNQHLTNYFYAKDSLMVVIKKQHLDFPDSPHVFKVVFCRTSLQTFLFIKPVYYTKEITDSGAPLDVITDDQKLFLVFCGLEHFQVTNTDTRKKIDSVTFKYNLPDIPSKTVDVNPIILNVTADSIVPYNSTDIDKFFLGIKEKPPIIEQAPE